MPKLKVGVLHPAGQPIRALGRVRAADERHFHALSEGLMADPQWRRQQRYESDPDYRARRQAAVRRYRAKKRAARRAEGDAMAKALGILTMQELYELLIRPQGEEPAADPGEARTR